MKKILSPDRRDYFIGTSDELKPTSARAGSEYLVINTGENYIFFNGMWERDRRLEYALSATKFNAI